MRKTLLYLSLSLIASGLPYVSAHPGVHEVELGSIESTILKETPEEKAPIRVSAAEPGEKASGAGFWRFSPVKMGELPEIVTKNIRGAHGTIVVDKQRDLVYWGLQNVGWVALSNGFQNVSVVQGSAKFTTGNLHGGELLETGRGSNMIAAADDVEGEIYLSDTGFQDVQILGQPEMGPYAGAKGFRPTDVTFMSRDELLVTDGYGRAFFAPADTKPLRYRDALYGGKKMSQTPHGITRHGKKVLISARPEGGIIFWDPKKEKADEVLRLPEGSTVCDVDIWEDYALAPCLNGPDKSPGPIYIVNLKKKTIASIIRPKVELGYDQAQHIHDAAWYVTGRGRNREVYIVFTNWNPGGIGVLKLVGPAE